MSEEEEPTITSVEAGSEFGMAPGSEQFGQVKSTPKAVPGAYPKDHANRSAAWKAAYDHAADNNNSVKAAILFAEARVGDFIPEETPKRTARGKST